MRIAVPMLFLATALAAAPFAARAAAYLPDQTPPRGCTLVHPLVDGFPGERQPELGDCRRRETLEYGAGGALAGYAKKLPGFGGTLLRNETDGETSFVFSGLDAYQNLSNLKLEFDVAFLGGWDVGDGDSEPPMYLNVEFNGEGYQLAMENGLAGTLVGEWAYFSAGGLTDSVYHYEFYLSDLATWFYTQGLADLGLSLQAAGDGYPGRQGQSWGIDNIRLSGLTAAVPEPSSWMLLIAGFGLIGFSMRRKRVRMVVFD